MKKYIALCFMVLIGSLSLNAQNLFATTCAEAPIVCNLDGYTATIPDAINNIDQPSTFCHNVNNNYWISFIAESEFIALDITITDCGHPNEGGGFYAHVYGTCGAPWTVASNCLYNVAPYSTGILTLQGLTIGEQYYLMVDGQSVFSVCEFWIEVVEGLTAAVIADAGEDKVISCDLPQEVILDGSNSIFGVNDSIFWTNENNEFLSDSIIYLTAETGKYFLNVYEEGGGCMEIDEVEVKSFSQVLPSPFLFSAMDVFPDTIGQPIFLDAINFNAMDSNYNFSWTTTDGNIIAHADSLYPLISSSGTYSLLITDPVSGCITEDNVIVNYVDPVSVFSPTKNTLDVEITPTITNDEVRVHYVMENANTVSMQIYNIGGVLLQDVDFGKKPTGEYVERLSLKDFSAGVYFVFVKTEEGSAVRKVVKM